MLRTLCLILALLTAKSSAAADQPVAVELVLAVDTSISVSADEYRLQMQGIANALRHPEITGIITDHTGGVAICVVHWSLGSLTRTAVGWEHLQNAAEIYRFAALVEAAPRTGAGRGTSISGALDFSAKALLENGFSGSRLKIDISGDARHNSGAAPQGARDRAVALGITINALVIEDGDPGLVSYYQSRVIGGEDAFVMSLTRGGDFARAMRRKLARELGPVAGLQGPGLFGQTVR